MTPLPRPVPAGFEPYQWASTTAEIAARHGLAPAQVIRFDGNLPVFPGVPRVPLGESFARLNNYPEASYRDLRAAAARYAGVEPAWIVPVTGGDGGICLVAQTYLAAGRRAAVPPKPAYPMYDIATGAAGAEPVADRDGAAVIWVCNPDNPTGRLIPPEELLALAQRHPDAIVAVDEAYVEFGARSVVPLIAESPNLLAIRTLSKAFGFAALRVGYVVAAPEVAADLDGRREPAPISAPAARIAAAALREPPDVGQTIAERERIRAALLEAGFECPPSFANCVWVPLEDAVETAERLEARGLVVRRYATGLRITVRLPAENDLLLSALGAGPPPRTSRSGLVVRTTAETALRVSLVLEGQGRARVATGIGFLDHLLTLLAFHGGLDLELLAAGDLDVDEHHTVEDVLAALGAALADALGSRDGVARYGSATVPMDEARATAAIDLVRRPHAEIALAFRDERVGGLAPTLLPHALERFAHEALVTLHVEASGEDDHHVAEAAFKALGRALREACAAAGSGVASTKGAL